MLSRVHSYENVTFKAIHRINGEKYTFEQNLVANELNINLINSPKDSFKRNLPTILEKDYDTDIRLYPSENEDLINVSLIQSENELPVGTYSVDNASQVVTDIIDIYPYSKFSEKKKPSSRKKLLIGALVGIGIALLGIVKCSSTVLVKNLDKTVVEIKANIGNASKAIKNNIKFFK